MASAVIWQRWCLGEVYNPAEYRNYLSAGFDYLYDKVGMYDTVREVMRGCQSTHAITGAWQQTDDIRDHMLYFLENHDEQRIASSFFAANARWSRGLSPSPAESSYDLRRSGVWGAGYGL